MARATYHHGDLRRALISATAQLLATKGPSGFSLREVARQAGVSPAAPSHHFGNTQGLITAVATEGFERLNAAFDAVDDDLSPHERLVAHGVAYVDLGISAPGHMAVMFRHDLLDTDDEAYVATAPGAFRRISAVVDAALAGSDSGADRAVATRSVWATCHGLAHLYQSKAASLADDAELTYLVEHAMSIAYLGMRAVPGRQA
ncbi:MAG: TetR/AcrR family transcriptional regulator [Actinomycetota bacterium]